MDSGFLKLNSDFRISKSRIADSISKKFFGFRADYLKVMLHQKIRNDDFQRKNSVAMLEQCCSHSKQCRNNAAMLCCAKNRRCESSGLTSPLYTWDDLQDHVSFVRPSLFIYSLVKTTH